MNTPGNEYELAASKNYVTAEQIARMGWHPLNQVPAIFFAKVGAAVMLNRKRLVNEPFLLDNNTMAFSMDSSLLDTQFGQSLFERFDLTSLIQVGALPSFNSSDVESISVSLPSTMDEQRQIGQYLCNLNTLITLHQRKYDKLVIFKKSMLEKMFPKDGESVPEIRFAGFTDPWEQRKFVDFVEASGIRNKDNLQLESYSVSNDRGFVPQDEQFENGGTMRDADKTAYWIVEPGSFAYNPARINVGSIGYQSTRKNVIVSSLYEVFKTDRSCDDRFLWHWFKSSLFTKQIEMLQEGGVRLYFFFDKLQKSEIWMPNVDEQRIIGQQFDQLDSLITLHQETLDPAIRWTDRVHSGDGMWSGNLFDFFFRVNRKLAESLKTPFKLDGIFRVDDTPMHKAVREALANCLFNADYHGVRGVVVRRTPDKLVFENPGDIRTGIEQMRLGGVSDPRNGLVMKMFSLIDVGERAGTGVPDVFATWANAGLPEPRIEENFGEADRTILTLMLEADAKPDNNEQISDDYEQINSSNEQITDNNEQLNGLNEQITERQRVILHFVEKSPSATYDDMARAVGVSSATVRRDAEILIGCGLLKRVGSRKAGHWEVRGEKNHDIR